MQKKSPIASLSKTKIFFTLLLISSVLLGTKLLTSAVDEKSENESFQELFNKNYKIFSLTHPESLSFAKEPVPMQLVDINERFDRELLVNTYWQSNTLIMIKRAAKWFPTIEKILAEQNVPEDFKYLALIESGFSNVVSPAGAAGYWQILKSTGQEAGLEINDEIDERYHVEKATLVACNYLKEAYTKFGSWTLAAASYNMGIKGLSNQIEKQKVNNYYELLLNEETSRYVFRILAAKEIISNYQDYGFHLREQDLYANIKTYKVSVDTTIENLSDFAKNLNVNYKILKIYNPWLRGNKLSVSNGKTYEINLPDSAFESLYKL